MNSSLSRITTTFSAIILISLAISSCDSLLNQQSSTSNQVQNSTSQADKVESKKLQSLNHNQKMVQLAEEIPGLGGLFLNDSGQLSIYLTDPEKQQALAAASLSSFKPLAKTLARVRAQGQENRSTSVSNMEVLKGQYTFIELHNWKNEVTSQLLAIDGVYTSGINQSENKLSIGVKNKAIKEKVSKKLSELNIPKEAAIIKEITPPVLYDSLNDEIPEFSGGLQISFAIDDWCTMGPTVRWRQNPSGPFTTGYITASHCTPPLGGGVNFTEFFQPVLLTGNFAGTEIRDPLFTRQRCWDEGQLCRESDAALISYVDPDPRLVSGTIYKTENRSRILGSREIPTYDRRFHINDINDFILEGSENNKIGARTGWTYGPVTETCTDITVAVDGLTYVCQNVVQAGANRGDSGAPVFETTAYADSVIFDGILSGGYGEDGAPYFWYSSVTRVENDLSSPDINDITFTALPPPISVHINGPTFINESGNYTYEARTNYEDGSVNYQWSRRFEGSSTWINLGTNKTQTVWVNIIDVTDFDIRVEVQDDSNSDMAQQHVTVQDN